MIWEELGRPVACSGRQEQKGGEMTAPEGPSMGSIATAGQLLRARGVWSFPLVVGSVLVMLMTLLYFGSIVDPTEHLHGLPVAVVDQDAGAAAATGRVDFGQQVVTALTRAPIVTSHLALSVVSLAQSEASMDKGGPYVTVVIPRHFTATILALVSRSGREATGSQLPAIELLTNGRAGTLGVSLADGVLQPALHEASLTIGRHLRAPAPATGADAALMSNPVEVSAVSYRPLPAHSGLGLSAFYMALLIMMCGFLGAVIVNTSVDTALGYASSEIGPWWKVRLPRRITRWQTLLTKWVIAIPGSLLLTGLLLGVAAGILRMDAPHWFELWMFAWFAAAVVALGTLALFAILGALGQLIALLVFVYLALASSGGTVPLQALAGFYRFVANFEPLRQILGAVRSILYFNGAGDAGLDRGLILTAIGFVFWVVLGTGVTTWYDRKGWHRLSPEILDYVHTSAQTYKDRDLGTLTGPATGPARAGEPGPSPGPGPRHTS
jgi:YhgE/Pip-like protein